MSIEFLHAILILIMSSFSFTYSTVYIIIMLLFAISNGYLTSLLMMAGISAKSLKKDEVDLAASILLLYLTAGLVAGAAFSFVSLLKHNAWKSQLNLMA